MKIRWSLYIYATLLLLCFSGCRNVNSVGEGVQKTWLLQEREAMLQTEHLSEILEGNSFDSIWNLTQKDANIMFYVFNQRGMVYWSENWLAGQDVRLLVYDRWYYKKFDNAHCVCRWTRSGMYNILTVLPIKYAYSLDNKDLRNDFVKPFEGGENYTVTFARNNEYFPVFTSDGTYIFSVCLAEKVSQTSDKSSRLAGSFSYQALLKPIETQEAEYGGNRRSVRLFFMLGISIFTVIVLMGVFGLIRNHGFKRMNLRTKFQYAIVTLLLINSVYVFTVSTIHVRQHYETQQRELLRQKTVYIQKALQEMYFWNVSLGAKNEAGMNIDLRDLSFAYETDIHVYDMNGNLVGTSATELFDRGLLSRHIAPQPFFSSVHTMVLEEHIGDMRYLAAYTEFYNGNYVQIGYITVPLFVSADAVDAEADAFLAKLVPPVLLVIVMSFLLSFVIARGLTKPLSSLSDKMRHFKIGQRSNQLNYKKHDEIGQLVVRYNDMVDELERSAEKLARSERETAWRTMARQIAHEINNPLTPMKLTIQQLQRTKTLGGERFDEYFDKSTRVLIEQIDNLSRIATSFSTFAKMPEIVTEPVNIAEKLYSVITLFRNNNENVPIRYIGAETGVVALADKEQISQVFNNLIQNALQAIESRVDGDIIVILKELRDVVEISVSDNGTGISEDIRDKVFRPNFTTKSTGMGLGLAISKNIVEGSGGSISFDTSDKGTTFYVRLRKA